MTNSSLPWEVVCESLIPDDDTPQAFELPMGITAIVQHPYAMDHYQVMLLFPNGASETVFVQAKPEAATAVLAAGAVAWHIENINSPPEE